MTGARGKVRLVLISEDSSPAASPHLIAGLLLAARDHQQRLGLVHPAVEQIVERTGTTRSSAYEVKARVLEALPSLVRAVGRPPAPEAPPPAPVDALCHEALRFVMDHPGCVHGGGKRRHYSDSFRRLLLDMLARRPELGVEGLAAAVEVPADTLRDWMRAGAPPKPPPDPAPATTPGATLHIETILAEWRTWEGGFVPFCDHAQQQLRVPLGRTAISAILEAHGVRLRKRRPGRSPDETALRESFETFFPGAQWVADGTPVVVTFLDERFTFNFELDVDAYTGAFTGASIRDEEDGAALIEALDDGKATTGAAPLALLVDNRASNLTEQVHAALAGETLLIPATKARPQNKAHCEGAFGLFFQMLPPLVLAATTRREAARELLRLVVTTWARTLNHRPRAGRAGKSRVDLYSEKPTPELIEQARARLAERLRRQELARRTLQARQDPLVRQTIAKAFARLGLSDPGGHLLDAIARYPLSAVVDGIALFEGKQAAGTLPPDADARYLLGIVRNIAHEREADQSSEAMLRARLAAGDAALAPLTERHSSLVAQAADLPELLTSFADHALDAERRIDRIFWLCAAGDLIRNAPAEQRPTLYRLAARRINTTHAVPYADRLRAVRFIANKAFPLE